MAGCSEVDLTMNTIPSGQKGGNEVCSGAPTLPVPECAICLQTCIHPVRLPCKHIFCFLCVKGASWQSKRCALCRQEVPEDFLERPTLLSPEELKNVGQGHSEHAWYYEGRNGWWQYDERSSRELEDAYTKGKKSTEMLIAGFLYVADLENMVQYRRNEHGRRRRMKRDAADIPKKGVAGLRLDAEGTRESSADGADITGLHGGAIVPGSVPLRPPSALGGQPEDAPVSWLDASPSLESSFAQLQVSDPGELERVRSAEGEGGEDTTSPSRGPGGPDTEDEDEEGQEDGVPARQRLMLMANLDRRHVRRSQTERPPPGGESASSSENSRRPDGQCTVTEV